MQEGRICPSFCEKIHKICIFFVKYLVVAGCALPFYDTAVPSDAALVKG